MVACLVAYWNTQIPLLLGSLTTALNTLSNETTFDQFYELMRLPSLNLLKTYGFQVKPQSFKLTVSFHRSRLLMTMIFTGRSLTIDNCYNEGLNNLFQALGTALYISMLSAAGENFASRVRLALFNSLVMKPMMFYDTHKVGELINRYQLPNSYIIYYIQIL